MDSFVFNSFKEKLINGKIPLNKDTVWTAYPVSKDFSNMFEPVIESLRSPIDFALYMKTKEPGKSVTTSNYLNDYLCKLYIQKYTYKAMTDTDVAMEPEFVTEKTWDRFAQRMDELNKDQEVKISYEHLKHLFFDKDDPTNFYREIEKDGEIVPRGFYYIRTTEELLWCANKVNADSGYDTKINIVLGDNIGTEVNPDEPNPELKRINFTIGSKPNRQFEGILYGNGFKIHNVELVCSNTVNGIVGYLGPSGIISTINITDRNNIVCDKKINLTHMIYDGSDIAVGFLCGKNNTREGSTYAESGKIENIVFNGMVYINGFYPQIYSTRNKTDSNLNSFEYNPEVNKFYPDYYCYNSPGNIIPYLGYFNEGVFATYSGYRPDADKTFTYWNTMSEYSTPVNSISGIADNSPLEWFYWYGPYVSADSGQGYAFSFTRESNRVNVLWYDGKIIDNVAALKDARYGATCNNGLIPVDNTTLSFYEQQDYNEIKYATYFNKPMKLTQQNRAAYYVSPLIGINNGNVNQVMLACSAVTSGTFVGFLGGIAGKQAKGNLKTIFANLYSTDMQNTESDSDLYYNRDYFVQSAGQAFVYNFPQKSIKNISSLFGSCVVGDTDYLNIDSVSSYFYNDNRIVTDNIGKPEYDDYYFSNRYGTLAAVVEYNSSNISDMWYTSAAANDTSLRSIKVKKSRFHYEEPNQSQAGTKQLYSPYQATVSNVPGTQNNMFGVAGALIAEIKPYYLTAPSVISTPFVNTSAIGTVYSNYKPQSTNRIGLFTIDQNIASPISDPYFWSISTDLDLPGVANQNNYCNDGYIGGVVDRVNHPTSNNFDIDIRSIGGKLVLWEDNCMVVDNYGGGSKAIYDIKLPGAAYIKPAYYKTVAGTIDECRGIEYMDTSITATACDSTGNIHNFPANKVYNDFAYFGSDISLIPNAVDDNPVSEFVSGDYKMSITLKNRLYDMVGYERVTFDRGSNHTLANSVSAVRIEIDSKALEYEPFTTTPITREQVDEFYSLSAYIKADGRNLHSEMTTGWNSVLTFDDDYKFISFTDTFDMPTTADWSGEVYTYGTMSGWSFKADSDEDSPTHNLLLLIPFDIVPYAMNRAISGAPNPNHLQFPPYNPFYGYYIITKARGTSRFTGDYYEWYSVIYPSAVATPIHKQCMPMTIMDSQLTDGSLSYTYPGWYNLNLSGSFTNYLMNSTQNGLPQGLSTIHANSRNGTPYSADQFSDDILSIHGDISNNMNYMNTSEITDYYKYTYIKEELTDSISALPINVKFDYKNRLAGFWFQQHNGSGEIADGSIEYNDNVKYYPNIFNIGTTLNQDSILNKCLKLNDSREYTVSGFSATDFDGLYVVDEKKYPVMYIDVGLGKCSDGTTWSYECKSSTDDYGDIESTSGLLLEVNADV